MTGQLPARRLAVRLLAGFACFLFGVWCLRADLNARDDGWAVLDGVFTLLALYVLGVALHNWRTPGYWFAPVRHRNR